MRQRTKSEFLYARLCEVIPAGVNSPVRAFPGLEQTPLVVDSAKGATVVDVDGHEYIDYCGSWGALIHGHSHPEMIQAVTEQLQRGTSYGITSAVEERLARKVVEMVPSVQKVRFVSSGTEATMSALRLARGFTGRDLVVKFIGNYHGHADFLLVRAGSGVMKLNAASSSAGVSEEVVKSTLCLPYNDSQALRDLFGDSSIAARIAAVIFEPVAGNMGVVPPSKQFLQALREECSKAGALLICDEVITGFRLAKGGAQELFGIEPDLTCLGKIVGGGFPAAAFGGRAEIMNHIAPLGQVYQAGTLSGNPVAMVAGFKALQMLEQEGFYEELERKTALLVEPICEALQKKRANACLQRVGSMFTLFFGQSQVTTSDDLQQLDLKMFNAFFRYLFDRGVYIPPSQFEAWFISSAHSDAQIKSTRDLILSFIDEHYNLPSTQRCS